MTKLLDIVRFLLPFLGLAAIPLAALYGVQTHRLHQANHTIETVTHERDQARADLLQTEVNYRRAADQARAADAANKARVEQAQKAISERITTDYEARLADARARAERLRQQLAAPSANLGGSGAASVSRPGAAPGGPDGPPADQGLSLDERLIATEQAIQLDALQQWVKGQADVDYNDNALKGHVEEVE